jgi:hypothetical protein
MNAIVRRDTVEDIVTKRNRAIALYAEAHRAIEIAAEAVSIAHEAAQSASPGINAFTHSHAEEIKAFYAAVQLPNREQYLRTARRLIDINVWSWIIERTDLERLMDKEAKDTLRKQMAYVPEKVDRSGQLINQEEIERGLPEVSVENIQATLEQFSADADMIFRRGIANAFAKLDRRFKSHDGFKVGSRVILNSAFNDSGHWSYYSHHRDTLIDIERTFAVLDGKTVGASYATTIGAIDLARSGQWGARQTEVDTEYFKIRIWMNGNAHLWFNRPDLVRKVNKLLAEYYGEVIADGQAAEEDPFQNIKTTPARRYGFFPTPDAAGARLMEDVPLLRRKDEPQLRILEPSAGTGNLARRCVSSLAMFDNWSGGRDNARHYRLDNRVDCVEIQPHLAADLEAEGIYHRVYNQDFLTLSPDVTGLYDRVVMNPPFDRERDIDHVMHALTFLKDDGFLTAIMSAGTEFRETKKATASREHMKKLNARWIDLPASSFASVGTNVNTIILRVWKSGRRW